MDYASIYHKIIERSLVLDRPRQGCERHHILPKSLGGSNDDSNLVNLTPREHFVCHLLLARMYTGEDRSKMCWALHRMSYNAGRKLTSTEYEMVRRIHVENLSKPKSINTKRKMMKPKSKIHSQNISIAVKKVWETRDRKRPKETIDKWAKTMSERYPNGIFYGKSHSQETKDKISKSLKGGTESQETKDKLSLARKGDKNPNYGKKHSEETREKMRAAWAKRKERNNSEDIF